MPACDLNEGTSKISSTPLFSKHTRSQKVDVYAENTHATSLSRLFYLQRCNPVLQSCETPLTNITKHTPVQPERHQGYVHQALALALALILATMSPMSLM